MTGMGVRISFFVSFPLMVVSALNLAFSSPRDHCPDDLIRRLSATPAKLVVCSAVDGLLGKGTKQYFVIRNFEKPVEDYAGVTVSIFNASDKQLVYEDSGFGEDVLHFSGKPTNATKPLYFGTVDLNGVHAWVIRTRGQPNDNLFFRVYDPKNKKFVSVDFREGSTKKKVLAIEPGASIEWTADQVHLNGKVKRTYRRSGNFWTLETPAP